MGPRGHAGAAVRVEGNEFRTLTPAGVKATMSVGRKWPIPDHCAGAAVAPACNSIRGCLTSQSTVNHRPCAEA